MCPEWLEARDPTRTDRMSATSEDAKYERYRLRWSSVSVQNSTCVLLGFTVPNPLNPCKLRPSRMHLQQQPERPPRTKGVLACQLMIRQALSPVQKPLLHDRHTSTVRKLPGHSKRDPVACQDWLC